MNCESLAAGLLAATFLSLSPSVAAVRRHHHRPAPRPKARAVPAKPAAVTVPPVRIRTVETTGALRLVLKQSGACRALAPADWTLAAGPQGASADLWSADGTTYAGWFVLPIDRSMQAWYGERYGDPEVSIRAFIGANLAAAGDTGWQYTSAPAPFGPYFIQRTFQTDRNQGILYYHLDSMTGGPFVPGQNYIESVYAAITTRGAWVEKARLALNVAASIHCSVQVPAATVPGGASVQAMAAVIAESNKAAGVEYAHSLLTGENYLLKPSGSWNPTGPLGPGYYRQLPGNRFERLAPGRLE